LVLAIALTIAACSGSDTVVAPLETPASSTVVPAPTTELTTTTSTTTSAVETTTTTTTIPDTTTTFLEVEVPATDPTFPELTAIFDEAFAAYSEIYELRRAAFRDPGNEALRAELQEVIEPGALEPLTTALDRFVDEGRASGPEADGDVIVLIRKIGATDDGSLVVFDVCQVLVSPILDVVTGEAVYEGEDAILSEASMSKIDGLWTLGGDGKKAEFEGTECQ
jgi:hypothetical protein